MELQVIPLPDRVYSVLIHVDLCILHVGTEPVIIDGYPHRWCVSQYMLFGEPFEIM